MKRLLFAATALIGVVAAQDTWALTATTSIGVSASVGAVCSVTTSTLAFLTVNTGTGVTNANATVNVTCTTGATYDVGLGYSANAIGNQRYLKGLIPANTLQYNLSAAIAGGANWGNVSEVDTVQGTGSGVAQPLTVFGQIPGSQTLTNDQYTDTVTVTVTY